MKELMLISILCLLAACGENSKKSLSKSDSSMGQPYISILTPANEAEVTLPITLQNEETVEPVLIVEEEQEEEVSEESLEVVTEEENETVNTLVCDFSNDNAKTSFSLLIKNKMVILKEADSKGKLTFDRHIFSPSGNENAAVHHEDENFSIEEGKVIKISARIQMNEDLKAGELQVSYKVKSEDKKTIQTEFKKLADINNCIQE